MACLLAGAFGPARAHAQTAPAPSLPLALLSATPLPVDFGFVSVRATPPSRTITITNLGSADLVVTGITPSDPQLTVDRTSLSPIPRDGSALIRVTFAPTAAASVSAHLSIASNDAFNPVYKLPVRAEGVDVRIAINPTHQLILPRQELTFQATVTGSPNKALTWAVSPAVGGGTISSTGRYVAPAVPITEARIIATSVADPLTSSQATVNVFAPSSTQDAATTFGSGAFATALVTGDLDGDGLVEVIVGAPAADVGVAAGAGRVWIGSFDGNGFSTAPTTLTAPAPASGGAFGTALLLDDVDGDGLPDLIVGEPGSGATHVFAGFAGGAFAKAGSIGTPAPGSGDRFGAALALGHFDGSADNLIAVGAPGTPISGLAGAGRVHLVTVTDAATDPIVLTRQPSLVRSAAVPEAGAGFGASLAAACLNDCSRLGLPAEATQVNDLIVGMPGATVTQGGVPLAGAGRVVALTDRPVAGVTRYLDQVTEVASPAPAGGARFGERVATADFTYNATSDLVVAAPGQPVTLGASRPNAGAVMVFLANGMGGFQFATHLRDTAASAGQAFGSALSLDDVNGDLLPDITVGIGNPSGTGSVVTYYTDGEAEFTHMRVFDPATPLPAARFGAALARTDLNGDGLMDLLVGAPAQGVGGVPGAGSLHVLLDNPPGRVTLNPPRAVLAMSGNESRVDQLSINGGIADLWEVVGGIGTVTSKGVYTPPATIADPLDRGVLVRARDKLHPTQWGITRIELVDHVSALAAPEITPLNDGSGQILLGLPEEGINFGSAVDIAPMGRFANDPFAAHQSVVGGFRAVNSGVTPRINSYPHDGYPDRPYAALQLYGAQGAERTGWGAQVVHGDFDGDGNTDLAIAAPFGSSEVAAGTTQTDPQAQVGFVDIYFMDADGNIGTYQDTLVPSALRLNIADTAVNLAGNAIWPSNPALPRNLANTRWGYRLLAQDINADGRTDLIVGAPHADVAGVRDAGLVEVLFAPPTLTGDWRPGVERVVLTEPVPRPGAYFGSAMAVGNVAGDGKLELFVGAPGRDPEGLHPLLHNDGIVYGFKPEPTNPANPGQNWNRPAAALRAALSATTPLTVADPVTPPTGHYSGFGMSLAVGNLIASDAADELAVGAPFRSFTNGVFLDPFGNRVTHESGDVSLYDGGAGFTVAAPEVLVPPLRQIDMHFGETLAVAQLSATGPPSLAVGAPFYAARTITHVGAVFLYQGTTASRPLYTGRVVAPQAKGQEGFGLALAAGDLDNDGVDELAVGAPSTNIDQYIGFRIVPGRFGGLIQLFDLRVQAGRIVIVKPHL